MLLVVVCECEGTLRATGYEGSKEHNEKVVPYFFLIFPLANDMAMAPATLVV